MDFVGHGNALRLGIANLRFPRVWRVRASAIARATGSVRSAMLPSRLSGLLRTAHREFVFRRAMQKFLSAPEACRSPKNPVLLDLIYGWGNEAWSAQSEYLAHCIGRALSARGAILECGSGLSTVLIGAIATRRGQAHWALEHSPEWAERTQRYLTRYRLESVVLCVSPLKDYGEFCWYAIPSNAMPRRFSLVLCDGPPGGTKGGRYGLVPVLRERFEPGCVILLDDAEREQERAIARRWQDDLRSDLEIVGAAKPFISMTVRVP